MRHITTIILGIFLYYIVSANAYEYSWQIDETPEGQESVTIVSPIEVNIIGEHVHILPITTATNLLVKKYSVFPDTTFDRSHTKRLLKTFTSIPQPTNNLYIDTSLENFSVWKLTDQHIPNDITIEKKDGIRFVTISKHAFVYANPLLAEIDNIRGRYFSKRLHRAVIRFVTDNGTDMHKIRWILRERYSVSVDVPNYVELTQHTTSEHAGRFSQFKPEEFIALLAMLEEYPSGMLKTPGLNYLVRRLDGTSHPTLPLASAVAWTSAGYIEFMELAFQGQGLDYIHRVILHEKAHFLWDHLFDDKLKQDWITVGGWYKTPNDTGSWSTKKQTEFVSAYAHAKSPNEDMAESISFYIVRPDKLRSRAPAKYEFIQNRIMHGTRYISQIREDLTFQVYNLYPDYVYPGKIVGLQVSVTGAPEEDKKLIVTLEIHSESEYDTAYSAYTRVYSGKESFLDVGFYPVDAMGQRVISSKLLRSYPVKVSKYAANGYWVIDQISVTDANNNSRYESASDIGWQMYVENPLADCDPPEYIPKSTTLALRQSTTTETAAEGGKHQILTVAWLVKEDFSLAHVAAKLNDDTKSTYSKGLFNYGSKLKRENGLIAVSADLKVPDYHPSGKYAVTSIFMRDTAGNPRTVFFSNYTGKISDSDVHLDEPPATIDIQTKTPDIMPPVLDLQQITIDAKPTRPSDPNGETNVNITFRVKDDISGYSRTSLYLRDPQGIMHRYGHWISNKASHRLYFEGDPTIYKTYKTTILLPIGSVPGTWGLAQMEIEDKARNIFRADFTEIVRFEITDSPSVLTTDVNGDGEVNILDLVVVANAFGEKNQKADVNGDGEVNILDLVAVANAFGE